MARGFSRDSGAILAIAAGVALALYAWSRRNESPYEITYDNPDAELPYVNPYDDAGQVVEYVTDAPASSPEHTPSEVSIVNPLSIIRGIRNNNPGNIRHGQPWQGLREVQTDSGFAQFVSMEYGIRALCKTLFTYADKYGLRNVAGIVSRWAPPADKNDTPAYIKFVSGQMGVNPLQEFNVRDPELLFKLVRAIIRQENGYFPSLAVSDDAVRGGIQLALNR